MKCFKFYNSGNSKPLIKHDFKIPLSGFDSHDDLILIRALVYIKLSMKKIKLLLEDNTTNVFADQIYLVIWTLY